MNPLTTVMNHHIYPINVMDPPTFDISTQVANASKDNYDTLD